MDLVTPALASARGIQSALQVVTVLQLTAYRFPPPRVPQDGATFDYVVVGGGTAGSIVASRLTEDPKCTVALIEAGGVPPLESVFPGLTTFLADSPYDYNFRTEKDDNAYQYQQEESPQNTAGKMLGGTSSLDGTVYFRGHPIFYDRWAEIAKDSSWNYERLLPYFKRSERLEDPELLNSRYARNFGKSGNIALSRQSYNSDKGILDAFEELGFERHLDLTGETNGVADGLFYLTKKDGPRQSTAETYLGPAKNRKNLFVFYHTTATKILFDENKNAVGVEALSSSNETVRIYARKEVELAAGVFKTPQVLLLSGIGPKSDLKEYGIPVLSDLPVGQTLQDQTNGILAIKINPSNKTASPSNPHRYPLPLSIAIKATKPTDPYDYVQLLMVRFPRNSTAFRLSCSKTTKYKNEICNRVALANVEKDLVTIQLHRMQPYSHGYIKLRSKNPLDDPIIFMGPFTNSTDLDNLATSLKEFSEIVNTSYFRSVGGELVDPELKECSDLEKQSWEYWRCFAKMLGVTVEHSISSSPMGTVLDSKLRVRGVQRLRVVDAAGIPAQAGKSLTAVVVFAEKASDLIKADKNSRGNRHHHVTVDVELT